MAIYLQHLCRALSSVILGLGFLWLWSAPATAANCGGLNQRACKIWERVPSCNRGLYEQLGKGICRRKTRAGIDCGRENQRACKIWERVPSCNKGLYEVVGRGVCRRKTVAGRDCGRRNQRPCKVWERIPSCNKGLYENFGRNRCMYLPPGQSPFLAGLGSAAQQVVKVSALCKALLGKLPSISVPNGPVNTAIQCRRGYEIGYRCAAPKLFNLLSSNVNLTARMDVAIRSRACQKAPGPLKTICAIGKVVDQFAIRPALCMTKVVANGGFTALAEGDSKTTELMCTAAGEYAFERAVNNALRRGARGRNKKARLIRKLRSIKRLARKGRKIDELFSRLEREPACRGVLN